MTATLQDRFVATAEVQDARPGEAITELRDIVLGEHPNDAESIKVKEQAIQRLADIHVKQKDAQALRQLLSDLRPVFSVIPKAKTAKIVRTIIETIAKVPDSTALQVCRDSHTVAAGGTPSERGCYRGRLASELRVESCVSAVQISSRASVRSSCYWGPCVCRRSCPRYSGDGLCFCILQLTACSAKQDACRPTGCQGGTNDYANPP